MVILNYFTINGIINKVHILFNEFEFNGNFIILQSDN